MHRFVPLIVSAATLAACWEYGGANTQQSILGNTDQGNLVGEQLIVSRDGRHLIASGAGGRGVYAVDLQTFASVELDIAVDASRMAFAAHDAAFFLSAAEAGAATVEKVSLANGRRLGRWVVPSDFSYMALDEGSERLAFWSFLRKDVHVLDPDDGALRRLDFDEGGLADVRWLPSGELAVVPWHTWNGDEPRTVVHLFGRDWKARTFMVPNCASRLVLMPQAATPGERELAMLAPTDCRKDPVSLVDLTRGEFIENLPGFGPVTFSPDGRTAIAFGRQAELAALGIETGTPFSLLFIDTRTLAVDTLDIGDSLPLYSLTPDGQVVLVYSIFENASYDGIFLIDIATRTIRETSGPEVPLMEYVVTPDSRLVYLIDGGLFRLDVKTGEIAYITLACGGIGEPTRCNPELVNMLPDGDTLVLGWRRDPEYALFDVPNEQVTRTFHVGPRTSAPPLAQ